MNSLRDHFPLSEIHGCFYHFTQNVWRHVQTTGLQVPYSSDSDFAFQIRLLVALAFLPSEKVLEAYEELIGTDFFSEESESQYVGQIQALLGYFQSTYLYRLNRAGNRKAPLFAIEVWNVFLTTLNGNYFSFPLLLK